MHRTAAPREGIGNPLQKSKINCGKQPGQQLLEPEDAAIARMISARAARGQSLRTIARTSRIPYSQIKRLAQISQIRYKNRRPTKEQIRTAVAAVRDKGATFRAAAKLSSLSKTAVHRYVSQKREQSIDSAGEIKYQSGDREYSKKKLAWLCPVHGRVTVWPCVACGALAAKNVG